MAKGQFVASIWDFDKENTTVTIPTVVIDETNLVIQAAYMDTFLTALQGVILGVIYKETRTFEIDTLAGETNDDNLSQRENKWLVQMSDDVTFDALTMTIGCADLTLLDDQNREVMDQSNPAYTAIKAAIENFYLSKAGNSVTVHDLVFVGRNL